jgi:hypothetical protein
MDSIMAIPELAPLVSVLMSLSMSLSLRQSLIANRLPTETLRVSRTQNSWTF